MLKKAALIFGIVLTLVGLLGFVPAFTTASPDGDHRLLLGIFEVDNTHNLIHLLTGLAAIAASTSALYARRFFQIFGIVYLLVLLIGLISGESVLGLFPVNGADNVLHFLITAFALYMGFVYRDRATTTTV